MNTPRPLTGLHITPYKCPFCTGGLVLDAQGREVDRCYHCAGTGLTDDPCGDADRAPRPPGVMRTPCADCAYRCGSPELEANGAQLPEGEPFFCHQGVPVSATGSYTPVAMFRGLPLGLMVCAGWWAQQTGEPLPAKPYREIPITEDQVDERWGHRPPVDDSGPKPADVVHPDQNVQVQGPARVDEFRRSLLDSAHLADEVALVGGTYRWVPPCPSGRHSSHPALTCIEHEALAAAFTEHLERSAAEARARLAKALVSFRRAMERTDEAPDHYGSEWPAPSPRRAMEILAPHLAHIPLYQPHPKKKDD